MEALIQLLAWHQTGAKPLSEAQIQHYEKQQQPWYWQWYNVGMFLPYWMNVSSLSHINYWGMIWNANAYLHILRNCTVGDKSIMAIYEFAERLDLMKLLFHRWFTSRDDHMTSWGGGGGLSNLKCHLARVKNPDFLERQIYFPADEVGRGHRDGERPSVRQSVRGLWPLSG